MSSKPEKKTHKLQPSQFICESTPIPDALKNFDSLPDSASVRQPVVEALFACSSSTVWRRVNSGLIPKPKKIGSTTIWNVGELRKELNKLDGSISRNEPATTLGINQKPVKNRANVSPREGV